MSSSDLVRWGAVGALLAGMVLIAIGLIPLVILGPVALYFGGTATAQDYLLEILFSIALVGMLAALVGFHARQAPNYGRLGTVGFFAAFVGVFFLLASTVATILAGREVLDWALHPRVCREPCGVRALGCGDPAGESLSAVVWGLAHRRRLRYPGLLRVGQLRRGDTLWSGMARVGVRPLVGARHVC
jgi:hypothetical protein